jgi:hypothetical protein
VPFVFGAVETCLAARCAAAARDAVGRSATVDDDRGSAIALQLTGELSQVTQAIAQMGYTKSTVSRPVPHELARVRPFVG